ncbi:MAG: acetyl-CoA carboxylase biotin carboxyl carrier protein subunit [Oscillospiraceae bacterium]|nr:acetyl-CoA carboxylase biotin carboxyl carrier protein subunit [Oscillospiraceae bacterium]
MKKYRVNVNGTAYEIELEELTGDMPSATAAAPVSAMPASEPPASGGENVTAPMPGTILSINIEPGTMAKRGQVLMILEAMKMENEILSPCDGKILSVNTSKGATVQSGTLLCVIDRRG